MKKTLYFISFNIIISFFYSIICGFERFTFLNCSFMIGMVYFLFGSLCFVWEKGFFNIILFSFNKASQQIQKSRSNLDDEKNISIEDYVYRKNHFKFTYNLLGSGFIISLTSTILSFLAIS